ncbi:MAG: hypothetical protein LBK70_03405 [Clostridiales bacterium]|jgi:hypothetical protein|nr:hypothetical protein [Clostridiales bacterium]
MIKLLNKSGFRIVVASLLAILMLVLVACTEGVSLNDLPPQNLEHIVTSNGGISVQYGNYVYFVNGYRGYADGDGNQNNDVYKGSVFRAELFGNDKVGVDFEFFSNFEHEIASGNQTLDTRQEWERENEDRVDLYFHNETIQDPNDSQEEIVSVKNRRITDKTVGTAEYKEGGIWIFGDHIYYATPANTRDNKGNLQTDLTVFYRTNILDGRRTEIYTTSQASKSSPYGFYMYRGNVYLTVLNGSDLVSVQASGKIGNPQVIAQDVSNVIMPRVEIYYKGMPEDFVENFVYFNRSHPKEQNFRLGNVLEMIRPNGDQRRIIREKIETTVHSVRDGLLFYEAPGSLASGTDQELRYDNLLNTRRDLAIERGVSEEKFLDNNTIGANGVFKDNLYTHQQVYINEREQVDGVVLSYDKEQYTSIYPFRSNRNSNKAEALATTASQMRYFDSANNIVVYNSTATIQFVRDDGFVYFTNDDNKVFRTFYNKRVGDSSQRVDTLTDQGVSTEGLNIDVVADHLVYFGRVDEWANNYAFFKRLSLNPETQSHFVGHRIDDDLKPEDSDNSTDSGEAGNEDGSTTS